MYIYVYDCKYRIELCYKAPISDMFVFLSAGCHRKYFIEIYYKSQ